VVLVLAVHLLMALQAMGGLGLPVKGQMVELLFCLIRVLEAQVAVAALGALGLAGRTPVGGMAGVDQQTASLGLQFLTLMAVAGVDTMSPLGMVEPGLLGPLGKVE
jgi:hypothetical protein